MGNPRRFSGFCGKSLWMGARGWLGNAFRNGFSGGPEDESSVVAAAGGLTGHPASSVPRRAAGLPTADRASLSDGTDGRQPSPATASESRLLLVNSRLNLSVEYTSPAGVLIETAKPSRASLRANMTATVALERISVRRRSSIVASIINVILHYHRNARRVSRGVHCVETLERCGVFAVRADCASCY
jgi:hypothetical protein